LILIFVFPIDQERSKKQYSPKRRQRAAEKYLISKDVLDKIGELASDYGDSLTARKATAKRPFTGPECAWLEAVVKMLVWQLGTLESERKLITMSDLPNL
jgi:hypothetical protein